MTTKVYFENLDGLRFIAFLSVFVAHSFDFLGFRAGSETAGQVVSHFFLHGDLGVNFFFVLSGFLITYLLTNEREKTSRISAAKFYMRRVLRIWPVYFLTIAIGFFIIPPLFKNTDSSVLPFAINVPAHELPWYAGFAVNFEMIATGAGYLLVSVLWSVSVEEQYYLVWPLVNKIFSKRALVVVICALLLASFYYRWMFFQNSYKIKYSTFSVVSDLAVGSLAGLLSYYRQRFRDLFGSMKKWAIVTMYVLLFACVPLRGFIFSLPETPARLLVCLEPLIFSFLFAFIILEQNYSRNSFFKISKLKPFSYLGTISYGLYSYHMICIFLVSAAFSFFGGKQIDPDTFALKFTAALALTILIGHISYRFFERPFLKLKGRYTP